MPYWITLLVLGGSVALTQSNDASDPEVGMSAVDIIRYWNYPAEEHAVVTKDGYILRIQRIPHGKEDSSAIHRPVVFLQHGLQGSSVNWLSNLPNQSAAFVFADAGFDVWLGNCRGNTYARNHTTLSPAETEFWAFSFDEMVTYDLDAMIDYVLRRTHQQSLYYVGHSQGTLIMFAKLADDPRFHTKLKRVFALAPVATLEYAKGMLEYMATYYYFIDRAFCQLFGCGEFMPTEGILQLIMTWVCGDKVGEWICDNEIFLEMGPDTDQLNAICIGAGTLQLRSRFQIDSRIYKRRTAVYTSHNPAGTSTQNVMHMAQLIRSGLFQKYDYGNPWLNLQHYGQMVPPIYDLRRFNAPLHIYHSDKDWLATEADVDENLLPNLNINYVKEVVKLKDFNHIDFVWGLRAAAEIYHLLLRR